MTLEEFVNMYGITLTKCNTVNRNPYMRGSENTMFNYRITIQSGDSIFSTYFSTGKGWTRMPNILDVMESLILSAGIWDSITSPEELANTLGFDLEKDKVCIMSTYKNVEKEVLNFKQFLGMKLYHEALTLEI